jgi:hypothetical protein
VRERDEGEKNGERRLPPSATPALSVSK